MSEATVNSQVRFSEKTDPDTLPSSLVDIADIKDYFGVTDAALDNSLGTAADIVSAVIRDYTGRSLSDATYVEVFTDVFEPKIERYLIETPVLEYNSANIGSLLNKNTGRIALTGGPRHEITYRGGYRNLPSGLMGVFLELVRQQMALMGHETLGTGRPASAPQEKAVWLGNLKVEYAISATSAQAKSAGAGGLSDAALAPYAFVLDTYRSRTRLVAT